MGQFEGIEGLSPEDLPRKFKPLGFTFNIRCQSILIAAQENASVDLTNGAGISLPFPCRLVSMALSCRMIITDPPYYNIGYTYAQVRVLSSTAGVMGLDVLSDYASLNPGPVDTVEDINVYVHEMNNNNLDVTRYGILLKDFNLELNATWSVFTAANDVLETYLTLRLEKL
jgi:hypothetical protein